MPENTAEMRRIADRATNVAANFQAGETGRQCRCRSSGRTTWGALRIPGIAGGALDDVVTLEVGQPDRHVGLAEHIGPGGRQTLHRQSVLTDHVVA